jgi:hypothetical protein
MADLIAFLKARLDEDEARANGLFFACRIPGKLPDFSSRGGPAAEVYWQHFTPDRMIREVEAKRAIIAEHSPYFGGSYPALRHLAAIYSDHPDYRAEWAA